MRIMTNGQVDLIKSLISECVLDSTNEARVEILRDIIRSGEPVPFDAAFIVIDFLLKAPRKGATTAAAPTIPNVGTYRLADGRVIRVVESRNNPGRRYGKVWDDDAQTWLYEAGLARLAAGITPLTLEEAEAFGIRTGQCAICTRTLTRADSIARGIGPVCASRF